MLGCALATLPDINGHVQLKDVFFAYEENQPVLKGVSLDAPAGTTTALVGRVVLVKAP